MFKIYRGPSQREVAPRVNKAYFESRCRQINQRRNEADEDKASAVLHAEGNNCDRPNVAVVNVY
jgi:hypothetical protein